MHSIAAGLTAFVLLCVTASTAAGAPVTYTFRGLASGTLGATAFNNALVTVTGIGDTSGAGPAAPPLSNLSICNPLTSVTVQIGGIGTVVATEPASVYDSPLIPAWGMSRGSCISGGYDWISAIAPEAAAYRLTISIGPIVSTSSFSSPGPPNVLATTGGVLNFTAVPTTFQAVVYQIIPTLRDSMLILLSVLLIGFAALTPRARLR